MRGIARCGVLAASMIAMAVGAIGGASIASAEDYCFGSEGDAVLCATLEPRDLPPDIDISSTIYAGCIYAGGPTCTDVYLPFPTVTPHVPSRLISRCDGDLISTVCTLSTA